MMSPRAKTSNRGGGGEGGRGESNELQHTIIIEFCVCVHNIRIRFVTRNADILLEF